MSVERLFGSKHIRRCLRYAPRCLGNRQRRETRGGGFREPSRLLSFWRPKGMGEGRGRRRGGGVVIASSALSIIVTGDEDTSIKGRVECFAVSCESRVGGENDSPGTRLRERDLAVVSESLLRTKERRRKIGISSPVARANAFLFSETGSDYVAPLF